MKKIILSALLIFVIFQSQTMAGTLTEEQKTIDSADKIVNGIVKVSSSVFTSGSGFYISPDLILTNEHVIRGALEADIRFQDGRKCKAEVGYREEKVDLAILKPDCTSDMFLTFSTEVKRGQTVIAAGNPLQFDFSVTKGIVSGFYLELIQLDAKVNYGSSGGVAANLDGEVIGVITAKAKDEKQPFLSFAIPSKDVLAFLQRSGKGSLNK